jgi:hypothetical protein
MTTTIRFSRSDGDYFDTTLDDLGIDQQIIDHYGDLNLVLRDVVSQQIFIDNGYIFFDIICQIE